MKYQKSFEKVLGFLVFVVNKVSQILLAYKVTIITALVTFIVINTPWMGPAFELFKMLTLIFSDVPKEFYSLLTGICLGGFVTLLYKDYKQEVSVNAPDQGAMIFDPETMQPVQTKMNGQNLSPFHIDENMEDEVLDGAMEGSEWEVRRKFKQLSDDGYFNRNQTIEQFKRGIILTKDA